MSRVVNDQRGIAHIALIIGVVLFVGVIGLITWRVLSTQQPTNNNQAQETNTPCESDDQDLCAFFASWSANSDYRVNSTQTIEGTTTTSMFESTNGGTRFHIKTQVGEYPYETISIGNTVYTKNNSDGVWYKQTNEATESEDLKGDYEYDFEETTSTDESAVKTEYKKVGTEACGDLTCLKYQIVDPATPELTQYLWFDTDEHRLRRMVLETPTSLSDQSFSYDNVSISEPTPVKELAENEIINPTTGEVITLPNSQ